MAERGISFSDLYVMKCLPSSLEIPEEMSEAGKVDVARRMDISVKVEAG